MFELTPEFSIRKADISTRRSMAKYAEGLVLSVTLNCVLMFTGISMDMNENCE